MYISISMNTFHSKIVIIVKFEKQKTKTNHNKCQSYLVKRFCITRIFITGNK